MRLSNQLLKLCSKNLGTSIELDFDFFKNETMLDIVKTDSDKVILDKLSKSSFRYYYASFSHEDFLSKIENLNDGYNLNLMNIFHIDINNRTLFICLY